MSTYGRYQRTTPPPVIIGADLIEQARQIERERTLLEVRRAIGSIPTTQHDRSSSRSWATEKRDASDFRDDVLKAITGIEARS